MCAEYIYDEAIIFKIHKKLLKVNNKKKPNNQRFLSRQ